MNLNIVKRCLSSLILLQLLVCAAQAQKPADGWTRLQTGWITTPDSIQTSVYWYWISGNVSREGVVKDLESMKRAGINRAFIGQVGLDDISAGKVKLFTPEWWDILHAALKRASELHIDIGMFDSPGWSGAGGPWIGPERSMRRLVFMETSVKGPAITDIMLAPTVDSFQDVKVIAYPKPRDYDSNIKALHPAVTAVPAVKGLDSLMDGKDDTEFRMMEGDSVVVTLQTDESFTARSLVIVPGMRRMRFSGEVQVEEGGVFRKAGDFVVERSNDALNTGFDAYAPHALSLPATSGRRFRIIFREWSKDCGIRELKLSASPMVANYTEKTLAKMYPTPLPYWKEYQWPVQPVVNDGTLVIDAAKVIDISSSMDAQGHLRWNAPAGNWVVIRSGMTPTRVVNGPAAPEGRGLQGDKLSKEHVAFAFSSFIGEILRRIPAADRTSFKVVVEDSYEVGGQNWTDGMIAAFKTRYGYDPLPYLPVMHGRVVGSQDQSDRFLWDLRRFVADKLAYEYVGGLREASHRRGLTSWLENYGHWGYPGEFLQYGGQSDEIGGEFWAEGELGNIENRAASSSAHIYGKNKVSAESFTAGGRAFTRYPAQLKPRGDRFFTEGINNTLLHVFISQQDDRLPGTNAWFSTEFDRHNIWFSQLDVFIQYLKRCNYMLRQGTYVADVAYFIGEDAPKMTGVRDPELPGGYSYDYINAEVLQQRITIKDGRWTLPDGLSYKVLVLPKLKTMRPELLKKLSELVEQGGVLLGPAPERSPSLENYGRADEEVRRMAGELWKGVNGKGMHPVGKGLVMDGMSLEDVFAKVGVIPDFISQPSDSLLFLHRGLPSGEDIYFVSNQASKRAVVTPAFRVSGKIPMLWDPLLGSMRRLPAYTIDRGMMRVPLEMERYQSYFIVFKAGTGDGKGENFAAPAVLSEVKGPWKVSFDTAMRGPLKAQVFPSLKDWSKDSTEAVKYFSGTATYRNSFVLQRSPAGARILLDLGMVYVMAKVKVNGIYVGGAWTPPYRVDITKALKQGRNQLEIEVVNTWVNRLIGDSKLPPAERKTWTIVNPYKPESNMAPSGLLGPVKVIAEK